MKINKRTILIFAAAIIGIAAGMVVKAGENGLTTERAKARYYYLQGSLEAASQHGDRAYEYFKKAYELDPNYGDAAFTYGNQRLFIRTDTLQSDTELKRSLEMMRGYVDKNPLDLYATQMYGYVTTALDTVEEAIRVYETTYSHLPTQTQLLQALADAYMRSMDGEKAVNSLEKYETIEGKSHDVSLKKITILLAMKDTLGAVNEADALIAVHPNDPYSRILKGNLYEIVGEMDSVVKAYKEAEALAPNNGAVKMSLANYYRNVGDSVMLDNMIYEALLSEEFELEDKLGILGDYLQRLLDEEGDRSRGDYLFYVLQQQYPHEPQVLDMSARYSGAKKNYDEAIETINYALDLDPTNERYWLMLLSFDLTDNRFSQAVKDYGRASEHIQPSQQLKHLYAMGASMLDNTEEAENILTTLIEEVKSSNSQEDEEITDVELRKRLNYEGLEWMSSLHCMLGDLYFKGKDAEKSYEEFEKSLFYLADNALTLNNYAYFLSEEDKELEKAKKMSRRSLELSENNPTYLDTYAWILYKMGDVREAREYMQLALDLAKEQGDENEEYLEHMEAIEKALVEMGEHTPDVHNIVESQN